MAKKKENKLSYLQMPLPESRKHYKVTKRSWGGLNYRQTIDTGALSMENNISTLEAPYLVPSQVPEAVYDKYTSPIGLFAFDNFLIVIYRDDAAIKLDYIVPDKNAASGTSKYTGVIKANGATVADEYPRCVVQFNVYDTPTDPLTGKYVKKLLIFPDKVSMDFEITKNNFEISSLDAEVVAYHNATEPYLPPSSADQSKYYKNTYNQDVYRYVTGGGDESENGWKISVPPGGPPIKYATVHLSRVFGVDDDRVYASGYNDYTNWNLDTIDEYNESNAWCSPAQSNTKAGGVFTGITTFQNHVICFKRDFMHEIYNTKNPFRIQDIYAEGAIDNRTIQDVDGRLIFASDDEVKVYTGSDPRIISYELNLKPIAYAVSGTDNRCYYLYCEDDDGNGKMYSYDTYTQQWSERSVSGKVRSFAHNKNGMYMLCDIYDESGSIFEGGFVYRIDTDNYKHDWSFETDFFTNETVDIKHLKKLQLLADVAPDASLGVYALYDDEVFDKNASHLLFEYKNSGSELVKKPIRVMLRQTAHYGIKLHFEGCGYIKLYELELYMQAGGDLYV